MFVSQPEDQLMCYLTYVPDSDAFRSLVTDNMHLNRHVREEINGPRSVHSYS